MAFRHFRWKVRFPYFVATPILPQNPSAVAVVRLPPAVASTLPHIPHPEGPVHTRLPQAHLTVPVSDKQFLAFFANVTPPLSLHHKTPFESCSVSVLIQMPSTESFDLGGEALPSSAESPARAEQGQRAQMLSRARKRAGRRVCGGPVCAAPTCQARAWCRELPVHGPLEQCSGGCFICRRGHSGTGS